MKNKNKRVKHFMFDFFYIKYSNINLINKLKKYF